jgi:putative addiction module killer protein
LDFGFGIMEELVVKILETDEGVAPFEQWYYSLKDTKTRQVILARLARLRAGNLGDWKIVGSGVFELRIDFGAG